MFDAEAPAAPVDTLQPLSLTRCGQGGVVQRVSGAGDLERRLLEIGFVEGARVRVLHQGLFGADPIAVQVDDTRVALRRREGASILVRMDAGPALR